MILCRRLLEQRAGRNLVLVTAIALCQHHPELVLRFGVGVRGL
jgi:hypothetical protein